MCLAIPSKIVAIDNGTGTIDVDGVRREVSLLLLGGEVKVGDYVIVHAGFAIHTIDEKAAEETLALLREAVSFRNEPE
jgi:hydrogenase expression/formation protein HypC